jgi:Flp pilus assembly protein TadG
MTNIMPRESPPRNGAAAVEFAAVMPLLVLLLVGIWEVGRIVDMAEIANNAAREGARQASTGEKPVGPDTVDSVERSVKDYLRNAGVTDTSGVTVTFTNLTQPAQTDPRDATQGDRLRLTVSVPIDSNRWSSLSRITTGSNLVSTVEWRCMVDIPVAVDPILPVDPATN